MPAQPNGWQNREKAKKYHRKSLRNLKSFSMKDIDMYDNCILFITALVAVFILQIIVIKGGKRMPGMPSAGGMEHKNDGTGNYARYHKNLSKLFDENGKMKPGDKIEIQHTRRDDSAGADRDNN